MSPNSSPPSVLILLVGSNPLPNYLVAAALRPSDLVLVYTAETKTAKQRLEECLQQSHAVATLHEKFITDATDAAEVYRTIETAIREWQKEREIQIHLNYTGGTKVMSVHARTAFKDAGGRKEHASYLEDGGPGASPRLRFDDGSSTDLSALCIPPLTLETILALHGARLQIGKPYEPAPTDGDADKIARAAFDSPPPPGRLHEAFDQHFGQEKNPARFFERPFRPGDYGLELSVEAIPLKEHVETLRNRDAKESWFRHWRKFFGGGWLEDWVAQCIQRTGLLEDPGQQLRKGFHVFRSGGQAQLEIDIAVTRNYRSYFLSCTTSSDKGLCKSKLFEIAVRAKQLAGDLARPALVCMADGTTLNALRAEVDDEPSRTLALRVPGVADVHLFGLEDLRAWAGWQGAPPNLRSLKNWLES